MAQKIKELEKELVSINAKINYYKLIYDLEIKPDPEATKAYIPTFMSNELEEFLGVNPFTKRTISEITKCILNYISNNNLKNPDHPREFLPDERLKNLIGEPIYPVVFTKPEFGLGYSYFSLIQYLKKHFLTSEQKLLHLKEESAIKIQRLWYHISSNPYHPIGKKLLQKKCDTMEDSFNKITNSKS